MGIQSVPGGGGIGTGWQFIPSSSGYVVPGAPTIGTATAGPASADLDWTAPSSDGGAPITSYTITPYIGVTAQTPQVTGSSATSATVTGLTNGVAYTFRVAATNDVGTGPTSGQSNSVTPSGGGSPVPMVSAYADYEIYTDPTSGVAGDFEFAEMTSMTGAEFLSTNPAWELTNEDEYGLPCEASLMSIVNGTGLVMQTSESAVAGIDTSPLTVSGGGFGCKAPYYREMEITMPYYEGEGVNHPSAWTLTTRAGDDAAIAGEIDVVEGGYGQNVGTLSTGDSSQYQSSGPSLPQSGTYKYGIYVSADNTSATWYCNNGAGGAINTFGPYDFPTDIGAPPADSIWYPLLDNAPGNPPATYGESAPTVTGANGEFVIGYDRWYVAP